MSGLEDRQLRVRIMLLGFCVEKCIPGGRRVKRVGAITRVADAGGSKRVVRLKYDNSNKRPSWKDGSTGRRAIKAICGQGDRRIGPTRRRKQVLSQLRQSLSLCHCGRSPMSPERLYSAFELACMYYGIMEYISGMHNFTLGF